MHLVERLGLDMPLIQAPMAGVQNWQLAAAVSGAGALGSIPCAMLDAQQIVKEVEAFRAACAGPYNLNFFCHTMPPLDTDAQSRWLQRLAPYYREYGLPGSMQTGVLRRPFDEPIAQALADVKPPVLSFHFGLPPAPLLAEIKSWGSVVLSSATTLDEGLWLQDNGADAIIVQGLEAGGHRAMFLSADVATQQPLQPLLDVLSNRLNLPLIAAGGISSSAQIHALMNAGASAVQVGTSYLLCDEADTTAVHRRALGTTRTTALTNVFSGRPARGVENRLMRELGHLTDSAPAFPYAATATAPLRKAAEAQGSDDFTPLWAGTDRSACREISAAAMTRWLWAGDAPV